MNRFLVVAVVLVMAAFTVSAQSTGRWTLGARLGPDFGIIEDRDLASIIENLAGGFGSGSMDKSSLVGFGFAPYVNYALTDKFTVQAELNFMFHQGMKFDMGSYEGKAFYHSLDLPVLFKSTIIDSRVTFGLQAGPYLSIPLGEAKLGGDLEDLSLMGNPTEYDIDGAKLGITAGLFFGIPAGPGRFVGDLRVLNDFGPIEIKIPGEGTISAFTRRGINLTVGYEISLGGGSSGATERNRGTDNEITNGTDELNVLLEGAWLNSFGTGTSFKFIGNDFVARFGTAYFNGTFTLSGNKITMTETSRSGSGSERFKGSIGTGTVTISGKTLSMKGLSGDWAFFNVKYQKE
jgi:hypothetical protein